MIRIAEKAGLRVKREQKSRKTHVFPAWVKRTAETEEQALEVERFLLSAETKFRDYFSIVVQVDDSVHSLQIDVWRVLFDKA